MEEQCLHMAKVIDSNPIGTTELLLTPYMAFGPIIRRREANCRYSTTVSALVFQTGDLGSNPSICSKELNLLHKVKLIIYRDVGVDVKSTDVLLILTYSVTVSTTDFDSVSLGSNPNRSSTCCSLEKGMIGVYRVLIIPTQRTSHP